MKEFDFNTMPPVPCLSSMSEAHREIEIDFNREVRGHLFSDYLISALGEIQKSISGEFETTLDAISTACEMVDCLSRQLEEFCMQDATICEQGDS